MSSVSLLLSLMNPVFANTWTVTSGGSIQSAINSAGNGDVIQIGTGTYFECLDPNGKSLTLEGTGTVLINGSSCTDATISLSNFETISVSNVQLKNTNGLVLSVGSGESAVLNGVTVTGSGYANQSLAEGGVIYVEGSVQIADSTFSSNSGGLGGVIYADGGSVSMSDSVFSANSASKGGGDVRARWCRCHFDQQYFSK